MTDFKSKYHKYKLKYLMLGGTNEDNTNEKSQNTDETEDGTEDETEDGIEDGTENEFDYYNEKMPKQIIYGTSKYNNIFGDYVPHTFDTESEDSNLSSDECSSDSSSENISTDDIELA